MVQPVLPKDNPVGIRIIHRHNIMVITLAPRHKRVVAPVLPKDNPVGIRIIHFIMVITVAPKDTPVV